MSFANPGFFIFIIIIFAIAIFAWWKRKSLVASLKFSHVDLVTKAHKGYRAQWIWLPDILKLLAFCFVVIALARPQMVETKVRQNVEGIDIVVALDVSDSMLIEDMKPENRLESSKLTIKNFIDRRVSDRIGLVVFSGESYTRVPLTLDYPLLLKNLSEVQTTRNIKMGTAIGVALANAAGRLKDSKAKSKVIIFLTDGENNSGTIDPITALSIAKDEDVKIYSIGMGKDGQAQLPVYIEDGRGNRIKQYRPMHSQINETLLRRFADETNGKFWRATTGKALENIFTEIDNLEKSKMEVSEMTKYNELFYVYLRIAFWLYLFGFVGRHIFLRRAYG